MERKCKSCDNKISKNTRVDSCKQCLKESGGSQDRRPRVPVVRGNDGKKTDGVAGAGPSKDLCKVCNDEVLDSDKGLSCDACEKWAHIKCIDMKQQLYELMVEASSNSGVGLRWFCNLCDTKVMAAIDGLKELEARTLVIEDRMDKVEQLIANTIEAAVDKLETKVDQVKEEVTSMISDVHESEDGGDVLFTDVVKRKKKGIKKNLLVIKSADENQKATEKKNEVAQALGDIQMVNTWFHGDGRITMNFENEKTRNDAALRIENISNITAKKVKKLMPKIMICNVYKEEVEKEIIDNLIVRNEYLQGVDGIRDKIEIVFRKHAAGDTVHYILKCDPLVRELIHKKNDRVKLKWGIYTVRDRYHAVACFHCQRYGHIEEKCPAKERNEDPICSRCAGNHRSNNCRSTVKNCINCIRFRKQEVNHAVNERCCKVLEDEIANIRNRTDYGY